MKDILCIDIGTTKLKVVIRKDNGISYEKYDSDNAVEIIEALRTKYDIQDVYLTGSGKRLLDNLEDYTVLNELEATAHLVRHFGLDEGLVVNIGTGTSFTLYEDNQYIHINGTGIGGGTFKGLGKRLLKLSDPSEIETLGQQGAFDGANIVIKDIYPGGLGWLEDDVTVANFGKAGGSDADIALGIHSLVAESILSMIRAMLFKSDINHVIICGGVINNQLIREIMIRYSRLFEFNCLFLEEASYGTGLGMVQLAGKEKTT